MQEIVTGIDVGSHRVKVVIAERQADPRMQPRILGTGYAQSMGLKRGYIVSIQDATRSIAAAASQAAKSAQVRRLKRAYVAAGGEGLHELFSRAEVVVERGDSEINTRDIERAAAASEAAIPQSTVRNRKILHSIAERYTVDGSRFLGKNPSGTKAGRLGIESLFIAAQKNHIDDLVSAVEGAGIEVEDLVASPLAASFVALSKMQKRVGVALLDIGAETSTLIVLEDDIPISVISFPLGADDVGGDIALGLKIPLEEAQQLKIGTVLGGSYPQKKIDEAIEKRFAIIFKLVEAHLKKIGKDALLPAGIVLTGGGASIKLAAGVAQKILRLPARTATLAASDAGRSHVTDGSWAVAYGLAVWGLTSHDDLGASGDSVFKDAFGTSWKYIKKFLP